MRDILKNNSVFHFNIFKKPNFYSFCVFDIPSFFSEYPQFKEKHTIDFFSVVFIQEGTGTICSNGHKNTAIIEKTAILISPHQEYQFEFTNLQGYILFFCQDFFVEEYDLTKLLKAFMPVIPSIGNNYPVVIHLQNIFNDVDKLFQLISNEYFINNKNLSASIIRSYLNIFILKISEFKEPGPNENYHYSSGIIIKLSELLEANFKQYHNVGFYSESLQVSQNILNDITRTHLNMGVKELIQRRLMSEARKLLLSNELTISEIAYMLNFQDNSYFSKVFFKFHNITPGDFRDIHAKYID